MRGAHCDPSGRKSEGGRGILKEPGALPDRKRDDFRFVKDPKAWSS